MKKSAIAATAVALGLASFLTGCGDADEASSSLSESIRADVAKDDSPETLGRLATYLQEHPDAEIDADLIDETADLLVHNMPAVRKTIADPGSPSSLDTDPEGLLRVVHQVADDEAEAKAVLKAVTTSAIDETEKATAAYVADPSTSARLDAALADSMVASGALATALGVDSYETPADLTAVLAYLVDGTEPSDLAPGVPLSIRTIVAANYLHAPEESLSSALAGRPRFDQPGVVDEIPRWTDSTKSPIPAANLPGTAEALENSWSAGEDLAIAARQ
ncbi:hypothetical protein [Nocardioides albus]|uniref:Uncharacterized protein n=1 Tax=Nocardioides albus TaxID=1841 RepID=A0A7W5A7E3_9ACTN|nr:hypothetical protein [Nocardioides albus]MBB3090981.1 hypothetical protein [Nocardioides albus]GGU38770.1 hypothetical protein GCM10007979_42520 [Nocardioides albus]